MYKAKMDVEAIRAVGSEQVETLWFKMPFATRYSEGTFPSVSLFA